MGSDFGRGDEGNGRFEEPSARFSFSGGRTGRSGTLCCCEARKKRSLIIELWTFFFSVVRKAFISCSNLLLFIRAVRNERKV